MLAVCQPKQVAPLPLHVTGVVTINAVATPTDVISSSTSNAMVMAVGSPSRPGLSALQSMDAARNGNPFNELIESVNDDPRKIAEAYASHRLKRNASQRIKLLEQGATGIIVDHILEQLGRETPGFVDPRNNISILARPPFHIHALIDSIQDTLRGVIPNLWTSPSHLRHVTVLEVAHTKTPKEILKCIDRLKPHLQGLVKYPCSHPVRLDRPLLSYDGAGVALTFLPAIESVDMESIIKGVTSNSSRRLDPTAMCSPGYTYHHLRRDMYDLCSEMGIKPESRYHYPSAHITIARFVTSEDFMEAKVGHEGEEDQCPVVLLGVAKMRRWIDVIEEINEWLMAGFWPRSSTRSNTESYPRGHSTSMPLTPISPVLTSAYSLSPLTPLTRTRMEPVGEWIIGKDAILDCRCGTNWYGGGENPLPEFEHLCGRVWTNGPPNMQTYNQTQGLVVSSDEHKSINGNGKEGTTTATVSLKVYSHPVHLQ